MITGVVPWGMARQARNRPVRLQPARAPTSYGFLTSNQTKHTPKREQAMKSQHDHGTAGGACDVKSEICGSTDLGSRLVIEWTASL